MHWHSKMKHVPASSAVACARWRGGKDVMVSNGM
jgi:hypothetical protein